MTKLEHDGPATRGLSCYTASLHDYLAHEWDAGGLIGPTVRLAVRVDQRGGQLAFSHHRPSLDRLPDGSRLRYAAAPAAAEALLPLAEELDAHGRAIAVADSSRLPWSAAREGQPAPHWLLLDGRDGDRWHVTDSFTALLPTGGEQHSYHGWLGAGQLSETLALPARWTPEQDARNTLAFGAPVTVPDGGALWLRRCHGDPSPARPEGQCRPEEQWLTATDDVLRYLAGYLGVQGAGSEQYLDDLWAAAGHHSFAYRWRLRQRPCDDALQTALDRWQDLPRLLRLAVLSAQRGRPRPTLVRAALNELAQAEAIVRGAG